MSSITFPDEEEFIKANLKISLHECISSSGARRAVERLADYGIVHPLQLYFLHFADIASLSSLTGVELSEIRRSIVNTYMKLLRSRNIRWSRFTPIFHTRIPISSGANKLDAIEKFSTSLSFGFYGHDGSGKTQLGLSLLARVVAPPSASKTGLPYLGGSALIIDFERSIKLDRIEEILRFLVGSEEEASRIVQDQVVIISCPFLDAVEFLEVYLPLLILETWRRYLGIPEKEVSYPTNILEDILPNIPSKPLRYIFIDGLSQAITAESISIYGGSLESSGLEHRSKKSQFTRKFQYVLQTLPPIFNFMVYVTFQVRTKIGLLSDTAPGYGAKSYEPAASFTVRHNVHVMSEIRIVSTKDAISQVTVIKGSMHKRGASCRIRITDQGVVDAD